MEKDQENGNQGMSVLCIIPARGGSKRIPGKNITPVAGLPLLAHSIQQARGSRYVSDTIVSTDDPQIAEVAKQYGARVVDRPQELSGDKASSESALLHALDSLVAEGKPEPDLIVFLQCTSPIRTRDDIDQAIDTLLTNNADSLFSACRDYGLFWRVKDNLPEAINYDHRSRKMEQDRGDTYRENGSIYVFKPSVLREGSRLGGKVAVYEMPVWRSQQIDRIEEVETIEWLMQRYKDQLST